MRNKLVKLINPVKPKFMAHISNGYWNSKFLNDKFFIKNLTNKSIYEKLYNTGDFLIKDKNDVFFYHGRQDFQIKIRGQS